MTDPDQNDMVDAFISYSGDDTDIALSVASELTRWGVRIWIDRLDIRPGASLSQSIDIGLLKSKFALPLLSRSYFDRYWTQEEIRGMRALHGRENRIIPIWCGIDESFVREKSPILADTKAIIYEKNNLVAVCMEICSVVAPHVYAQQSVPKSTMVKNHEVVSSPLFRDSLSPAEISRAQLVHAVISEHYNISLEQWLEGFCRDSRPHCEILNWEVIATAMLRIEKIIGLQDIDSRLIFSVVLGMAVSSNSRHEGLSEDQIFQISDVVKESWALVRHPPQFIEERTEYDS